LLTDFYTDIAFISAAVNIHYGLFTIVQSTRFVSQCPSCNKAFRYSWLSIISSQESRRT